MPVLRRGRVLHGECCVFSGQLAKTIFPIYNGEYYINWRGWEKAADVLKESRPLAVRAAEVKQRVTPEPAGRPVRCARYAQMSDLYDYLGGTAEVSFVLWDEGVFLFSRSESDGRNEGFREI